MDVRLKIPIACLTPSGLRPERQDWYRLPGGTGSRLRSTVTEWGPFSCTPSITSFVTVSGEWAETNSMIKATRMLHRPYRRLGQKNTLELTFTALLQFWLQSEPLETKIAAAPSPLGSHSLAKKFGAEEATS